MDIGKRIALIRKKRELTQGYLAKKLNRTPQWLSNIERGTRPIDTDDLVTIAGLLQIDPGYFFDKNFNEMCNYDAPAVNQ